MSAAGHASRRRRPGRTLLLLLASAPLLCALPGGAPAQERRVTFRRSEIEVGGKITEVVPADLSGDGRVDLFVVRGREALIYVQRPDGGWPAEPNQRFRFHPRTILFDMGDVTGDGRAEVVLLMADGLRAYRLRAMPDGSLLYGLRPEPLVDCPSFLTRPVEDEVRRKELLRDLDGDGDLDALVPRRDGFSVLRNEGQGRFAAPQVLTAPPRAILHTGRDRLSAQLFGSYWFANPNVVQWDAQGPHELVLVDEAQVSVFGGEGLPLEARGSYGIADQKQFSMNVENPFELDFSAPLAVRDLDRDGRADVVSTHVGQGVTRVFRNGPDARAALASPEQTIRAKGVTFVAFLIDLDGDGKDDLVLPRMDKIGVWSILKVLVTRSVPVEVLVFYQRAEGRLYPDEPDHVRQLDVPLAISSKGEGIDFGTTVVATVEGDFDGDGKRDLLLRTDDDELGFFAGQARGIATSTFGTAEIRSVADYRFCVPVVVDLDADRRDDVVLRYYSWDRKADRLTILQASR